MRDSESSTEAYRYSKQQNSLITLLLIIMGEVNNAIFCLHVSQPSERWTGVLTIYANHQDGNFWHKCEMI